MLSISLISRVLGFFELGISFRISMGTEDVDIEDLSPGILLAKIIAMLTIIVYYRLRQDFIVFDGWELDLEPYHIIREKMLCLNCTKALNASYCKDMRLQQRRSCLELPSRSRVILCLTTNT